MFDKISKTNGVFVIACICMMGLIAEMILSYFIVPVNREIVIRVTGLLINTVTAVVSFFMGASRPDDKPPVAATPSPTSPPPPVAIAGVVK